MTVEIKQLVIRTVIAGGIEQEEPKESDPGQDEESLRASETVDHVMEIMKRMKER